MGQIFLHDYQINLHYRESGPKQAPTLLLLHGNSCSSHLFSKIMEGPLSQHFHMIAPDLPGHGQSDKAKDPLAVYSLRGLAKVIKSFLNHLHIDDFSTMGNSLGGHIALQGWGDLLVSKKVMVFGTPPVQFPLPMDKMYLPNPLMGLLFSPVTKREDAEKLSNEMHFPNGMGSPTTDDILQTDPQFKAFFAESIGQLRDVLDEMSIIKKTGKPLCIAHGQEDRFVQSAYFSSLDVPHFENKVHVIEQAGHLPQWDNPEKLSQLAERFFKG